MRLRRTIQNEGGQTLLSGFANTMFDKRARFHQSLDARRFIPQLHGAMLRSASLFHNCRSL
jgi:hypothetical protein